MYIFLFVLIFLTIFLFTNVVAVTEYNEKKFIFEIYLWKIKLTGNKKKTSEKGKTTEEKNDEQKLSIEKINHLLDILKEISVDVKNIFRIFKRKIKGTQFLVNITFGLPDAAETGIATGIFWAFIGFVYPVIDTVIDIENPEISVNPKFNCEYYNVEYKGIYKLKIIHIIYIALCSIKIFLKLKKKIKNGGV